MLAYLIAKTSGETTIGDYEIGNDADAPKIRKIIGLVPDNVGFYEDLSAYRAVTLFSEASTKIKCLNNR